MRVIIKMGCSNEWPIIIYGQNVKKIKPLTKERLLNEGWKMGLEPTTFGTTIRRSNQLSYVHHFQKTVTKIKKENCIYKAWLSLFFYNPQGTEALFIPNLHDINSARP